MFAKSRVLLVFISSLDALQQRQAQTDPHSNAMPALKQQGHDHDAHLVFKVVDVCSSSISLDAIRAVLPDLYRFQVVPC